MPSLIRPMTEAIAEVMRQRFRVWAGGPKPSGESPAPPSAGASFPPGQALASRSPADQALLHRFHTGGETRCVS